MHKILVLPGDGIGKEVCQAAVSIFDHLDIPLDIEYGDIGWECWKKNGDPVPQETWSKIDKADAVLLGAITSKGKRDSELELSKNLQNKALAYTSPLIQMRQKLELFANVRPVENLIDGNKDFRCVVLRENTEGLYCGLDYKGIPEIFKESISHQNIKHFGYDNVGMSIRLVTQFGLERIIRFAFEYATKNDYKRVTFAEKPNVLRNSGQFSCDIFEKIASEYPDIDSDIQNVDAIALWLVKKPEKFGVIVGENMYGDILSDLAAGIMGGLGVAPSANIGINKAYFEPVHGSAPGMAGKNLANPAAMFLTISLMLDHLGYSKIAKRISRSVSEVISSSKNLTYDFGGKATTEQMSNEIISVFNGLALEAK